MMLTQEFIIGIIVIAAGSLSLYLVECDWYRKIVFSGYWKRYNTPSGKFWAQVQNIVVIALGLAMCCGLIGFNK